MMNRTIQFETKSHYGGPELIYVTSEQKGPLEILTGKKTLSERHVKALKDLGYTFYEVDKPKRILSMADHVRYMAHRTNRPK